MAAGIVETAADAGDVAAAVVGAVAAVDAMAGVAGMVVATAGMAAEDINLLLPRICTNLRDKTEGHDESRGQFPFGPSTRLPCSLAFL